MRRVSLQVRHLARLTLISEAEGVSGLRGPPSAAIAIYSNGVGSATSGGVGRLETSSSSTFSSPSLPLSPPFLSPSFTLIHIHHLGGSGARRERTVCSWVSPTIPANSMESHRGQLCSETRTRAWLSAAPRFPAAPSVPCRRGCGTERPSPSPSEASSGSSRLHIWLLPGSQLPSSIGPSSHVLRDGLGDEEIKASGSRLPFLCSPAFTSKLVVAGPGIAERMKRRNRKRPQWLTVIFLLISSATLLTVIVLVCIQGEVWDQTGPMAISTLIAIMFLGGTHTSAKGRWHHLGVVPASFPQLVPVLGAS